MQHYKTLIATGCLSIASSLCFATNINFNMGVQDVSYFDVVAGNNPELVVDPATKQRHFDGKNAITMRISNNALNGYTIYANATNGAMVNIANPEATTLPYQLDCPSFRSQYDSGVVVNGLGPLALAPGYNIVLYDIDKPRSTTNHASVQCNMLAIDPNDIEQLIAGNYSDTIEFSMIAK